jgi:hypothetical protein
LIPDGLLVTAPAPVPALFTVSWFTEPVNSVTVAVAVSVPPLPVAVAVYFVVDFGLTVWVPPFSASV